MKQNQLLFSVLFTLVLGLAHLRAQPTMYVHETNTTITSYPLDSIRKLTFPAGVMQVHRVIGDTISYAFSNIRYVDFGGLSTNVTPVVSADGSMKLYPVPAGDELHLDYTGVSGENVTIEIVDLQGRVVVQQQTSCAQSGTNQSTISIADLAQGVYICRVRSESQVQSVKFSKN